MFFELCFFDFGFFDFVFFDLCFDLCFDSTCVFLTFVCEVTHTLAVTHTYSSAITQRIYSDALDTRNRKNPFWGHCGAPKVTVVELKLASENQK